MVSTYIDRIDGVSTSVAIKAPCVVETNVNITLSGLQTVNSVAVVADDRVLVKDQTDQTENGIYDVNAGEWTRALDFNGIRDVVQGTIIPVYGSLTYENTTSGDITFGTTSITIAIRALDGSLSNIIEDITPQLGGNLDGNGKTIFMNGGEIDMDGGQLDMDGGQLDMDGGQIDMNGGQMRWSKGADVVCANALPLLTDGNYFDITTGDNTVTSINTTSGTGTLVKVHCDVAILWIHHATNLIMPGAVNYQSSAGDELEFLEYGVGIYRCTGYALASGKSMVDSTPTATTDFSTGDAKLTYKTSADTGWIIVDDGSIGNASSSGTTRANADTENLFTLFYDNMSDSECPVSSGRGANAAADFAANKNITIPLALGRALAIAGTGSGLTARTLGDTLGEEDHIQLEAELDAHAHSYVNYRPGGLGSLMFSTVPFNGTIGDLSQTTDTTGSSTAFNIMQPTGFINMMVKL